MKVLNKYSIICIFLFLIVGFFIGTYSVNKFAIEKKGYDIGYSAAWTNATAVVDENSFIGEMSSEIYSISGTIKNISVSKNSIIIEAYPVSFNPLSEDSKKTMRTVKITTETNLLKYITKSDEEIQNMIATNNFNELMSDSKENITLDQLNVGDFISVESDYNIKHELEFVATTITVQ